jgi:hypothetical protein
MTSEIQKGKKQKAMKARMTSNVNNCKLAAPSFDATGGRLSAVIIFVKFKIVLVEKLIRFTQRRSHK